MTMTDRTIHVIGDRRTVQGFLLVGAEGRVVESEADARAALDSATGRDDVGLILVSAEWAERLRDEVDTLMLTRDRPLVAELPGADGEMGGPSTATILRQATGIAGAARAAE
ncbi:hypothetical protein GF314_01045 [bacterium]|nr:hypothetical protein [bacterium]